MDRSSLLGGKLTPRPGKNIGEQILEWIQHGQPQAPAPGPERVPLFNESGDVTGEKETTAILEEIGKATTLERLNSIHQSRLKGITTKRLNKERAKKVAEALASRRRQLQSTLQPKAA